MMISLTEARARIAAALPALPPRPTSLREARGRYLREEILARHDLPAFDRSAMDGYAVGREDPSPRFRVKGEMQPGQATKLEIGIGECVRIFTGAPLPRGASQVLMQEEVRREGAWITPIERSRQPHVRYQGEDLRAGQRVLAAGTHLQPAELSLLAHLGCTEPLVSAAPRVLHLATGRELVDPAHEPALGEIRDSNSTLLATLLDQAGAALVHQGRCGDELATLVGRVEAVEPETWDLLLISGGASVGDYDFGRSALQQCGFAIHFEQLDLRPGKPLVFGSRGRQAAFVIPGNPVSHFVLFHVAILAALEALQGEAPAWRLRPVPLAEALKAPANARETYWPARLAWEEGPAVTPLRWQSSGDLSGIAGANALIQIAAHRGPLPAGTLVPCVLL